MASTGPLDAKATMGDGTRAAACAPGAAVAATSAGVTDWPKTIGHNWSIASITLTQIIALRIFNPPNVPHDSAMILPICGKGDIHLHPSGRKSGTDR